MDFKVKLRRGLQKDFEDHREQLDEYRDGEPIIILDQQCLKVRDRQHPEGWQTIKGVPHPNHIEMEVGEVSLNPLIIGFPDGPYLFEGCTLTLPRYP